MQFYDDGLEYRVAEYQLSTGLLSNKRCFTAHPKRFISDFCWLVVSLKYLMVL